MEKGYIQIHVSGMVGTEALSPANYDIGELKNLLSDMCALFDAATNKKRPNVSLEIENGSFIGKFIAPLQVVALAGAVIGMVQADNSLRGLTPQTAEVFENMQKSARRNNYTYEITSSLQKKGESLFITPQTMLHKEAPVWVQGEFFFYGTIVDAGGKTNPNIHLEVKNLGTIAISAPKEYLANQERNLLYHKCGVRVKGKQNPDTGEYGTDFELVEITDYTPAFDEKYLDDCIRRASEHLKGIDAEEFLKELRGEEEYA